MKERLKFDIHKKKWDGYLYENGKGKRLLVLPGNTHGECE